MHTDKFKTSNTLELRIPPPAVALIIGTAMWGASFLVPSTEVPPPIPAVAAAMIAVVGLGFDIAGIVSFLRAGTTVNPMRPATTARLVSSGVYAITRNPMYLGMFFVLLAWAVFLSSCWLLPGPLAFMVYMNRFQIAPEEQALLAKFGSSYAEYQSRVRRWL